MTVKKPPVPDDEVVYLEDDGRDELARALEEAERAVSAVEERHKIKANVSEEPAESEDAGVELVVDEDDEPRASARPAPAPPPAPDLGRHLARIEELETRLGQTMDRALRAEEDGGKVREALVRTNADFENLKKRTEREKTDYFKFALAEVFREVLPVLDNFERAMAHVETGRGGDFFVGVEMIARQLADVLKRFGLAEVPALGLPFDPNVHEAVVREETEDAAPGTVLAVLQRGYLLNDKLLRPALVKVAGAPTKPAEPDPGDVFPE